MAKFFNRKEKKPAVDNKKDDKKGLRALTSEEAARADKMQVGMTRDELKQLMRDMGKTEEEIKEMFPDPLPKADQEKLLAEVRQLFSQRKYDEVISTFSETAGSGLLTGSVLRETYFAIGYSGVMTRNKDIIRRLGGVTIAYLLHLFGEDSLPLVIDSILDIMRISEEEVPGCMKETARKLYPMACNYLGTSHEMTLKVKSYM